MKHRRTIQRRLLPRVAIVGLLAGWAAPAGAATKVTPTAAGAGPEALAANATVDPTGRIVPIIPPEGGVDVIGAASSPSGKLTGTISPCPDAKPLSAEEARGLVAAIARQEEFYPDFVLSVAKIESGYRSTALSGKGAYGLMQLMPATAATYKVDLCKPAENVRGGILFLRDLHTKYRNPFFILAAYNAGEVAVKQARGVPPVAETVRFVADVMNDFYDWPALSAGKAGGRTAKPVAPEPADPKGSAEDPTPGVGRSQWSEGFVMHVE